MTTTRAPSPERQDILSFAATDPGRCDGCEACAHVCPRRAVVMREDQEGFHYPSVDFERCNRCGACERACPAITPVPNPNHNATPAVFAGRVTDALVQARSSSGGIFSALATVTLKAGGAVVGARFVAGMELRHALITDIQALPTLRGSKYVPSLVGDTLPVMRRHLRAKRPVLFVGTPCQVAGIRRSLSQEQLASLTTCDLVCHGVPSPQAFRSYLRWLEARYRDRVVSINFRDKKRGWKRSDIVVQFADGREYRRPTAEDPFLAGFIGNLYLRPSCHSCRYAHVPRIGDITLGDFWGLSRVHPTLDDDRGTSVVLANNEAAVRLLASVAGEVVLTPASLDDATAGNPCLVASVAPSPMREHFMRRLSSGLPFDELVAKHLPEFRQRPVAYRFLRSVVRFGRRAKAQLARLRS